MRRGLLYLGLGTILLGIATALVISFNAAQRPPTVVAGTFPQAGGGRTARQAYTALQPWAKQWADDTQVVALSTSLFKSEGSNLGWSCQVYSRQQHKIAVVLIQGDQVWVLREQPALYQQHPIEPSAWKIDSNELLSRWWEQRGHNIWPRPGEKSMYLHLGVTKRGDLTWQLNILNANGDLIDSWSVRADTGEILSHGTLGGEK